MFLVTVYKSKQTKERNETDGQRKKYFMDVIVNYKTILYYYYIILLLLIIINIIIVCFS